MRISLSTLVLLVSTAALAAPLEKPTYAELGLGVAATANERSGGLADDLMLGAELSAATGHWVAPWLALELEGGFGRATWEPTRTHHNRVSVAFGARLALPWVVGPFVAAHTGYRYDRGRTVHEELGVRTETAMTTHQLFGDAAAGLQVNVGAFTAQTAFRVGANVRSWARSSDPAAEVRDPWSGGAAHYGWSTRVGVRW